MSCADIAVPFDPSEVTKAFADLCKQYHIRSVVGDAYSAEWCCVRMATRRHYVPSIGAQCVANSISRHCPLSPAASSLSPTMLCCCASCACSSDHQQEWARNK